MRADYNGLSHNVCPQSSASTFYPEGVAGMRQPKSRARWLLSVFAMVSAAIVVAGVHRSSSAAPPKRRGGNIRVEKTVRFQEQPALSFEGGTGWINTGPIRLEELRGKVVLLDFWTFCCINCHHVLPDLAKLEQKYKNELVVIGVHSPKFFGERDTENIRQKVHEYQIKHPVVNDADQVIWNRFQVRSWPTIVLVDPQGHYYGSASGEGNYEALDHHIGLLVAKHKEKGDLNLSPLTFFPESDKPDETPLSYPGKVVADPKSNRLFIADTAHNRLVMTDLDGAGAVAIGNGVAGLVDGDFA
ncbi:thioredoxin-like domain-containing protein, partial [Singulisphaera rosea]